MKNDVGSSDDEEYYLVSCEPYSVARKTRKIEIWMQCIVCKLWSHDSLTPQLPTFICKKLTQFHSNLITNVYCVNPLCVARLPALL